MEECKTRKNLFQLDSTVGSSSTMTRVSFAEKKVSCLRGHLDDAAAAAASLELESSSTMDFLNQIKVKLFSEIYFCQDSLPASFLEKFIFFFA